MAVMKPGGQVGGDNAVKLAQSNFLFSGFFRGLICIGLNLLVGCSTVPDQHAFYMPRINEVNSGDLMWPPLPEVPRYSFIGHLYGESNTNGEAVNDGTFSRLFAAIVGLGAKKISTLDLVRPQQVSSDNNGRIFVADPGRQSIFVFDEALSEFDVWNETSLGTPLLSPIGLTYAENSLWVTDSELSLVYQFNDNGEVINTFGRDILKRPTGITYDSAGKRLLVSDTAESNIKLFDISGKLIDIWGVFGTGDGELNRPTYLVYRQGNLYVTDSLNARIQVFDEFGQFLQTVGQRGLYIGNFSRPKGVALDSDGNIYVSESYYDHVLIYNRQGELLMSIGGSGSAPGQFSQPTGLWVDNRDRLFISDMLNSRVSMFQYLGNN
jgi:DNA-binding beta-propeller fold protein YncE